MSRSEDISRRFYERLGARGLAARTRAEWDEKIVRAVIRALPERSRILDVGCGYGRIALPLVRAGFTVQGLDLSPSLIESARDVANADGVALGLTIASMKDLPYATATFDVVICLWSAFNELLEEHEQVQTIGEMWRVLRRGGFALIEGRISDEPSDDDIASGARRASEQRVDWSPVEGLENPHYRHDERSLRHVCEAAGVQDYRVFERDWGGRQRLFLRLDKPAE